MNIILQSADTGPMRYVMTLVENPPVRSITTTPIAAHALRVDAATAARICAPINGRTFWKRILTTEVTETTEENR